MKKILLIISLFIFIILGGYQIGKIAILDQDQINIDDKISYLIPVQIKKFLKKTLFLIPDQKRIINTQNKKIKNYEYTLDIFLGNIKNYNFTKLEIIEFQSKNLNKYLLEKFDTSFSTSQNIAAKSTTYFDTNANDIFLASSKGVISYFDNENLKKKNFQSNVIESNLTQVIKDSNIYFGKKGYGIKDLFIYDNKIYLSFSNEVSPNCYNTGVVMALLNKDFLNFKRIFSPVECVLNNQGAFYPFSAGGRIVQYDKNHILLSHGDYLIRHLAQDRKSVFGKIIKINTTNQKFEIMSMGHRNPQGLKYDSINDIVYISEHGPTGGDEINIISNTLRTKELPNFGWPLSTYGVIENYNKQIFENHKDYGFIEPSIYFTPSIGISEIDYFNKNDQEVDIFVSSLGYDLDENDLSIHHLIYDKDRKSLENFDIINIGERIRDMFLLDDGRMVMYLETSGSLAILKKKN